MSDYFSQITNLGVNLAIENIPVRDLNVIKEMQGSDKKKKEKVKTLKLNNNFKNGFVDIILGSIIVIILGLILFIVLK